MLTKNVGTADRIIRIVVGLVLIGVFFTSSMTGWSWLLLIGIVPLVTGLMGTCPAYTLLGTSTCST